jgi:hypothetical protein
MKQKIAFFIDTSQTSGGAFSEVIYMLDKLRELGQGKIEIEIITTSKKNLGILGNKIKLKLFKMNIFQRYICYLRNYNNFIRKIKSIFFKNSFENFLNKNNIDIVYFVSPSQYSLYIEDTDFIITVPDVSHRENVEFPEWAKLNNFTRKENILSKVLIKSIAVVTNAEIIKKKIIKFYRVEDDRVIIINHQPSLEISKFDPEVNKISKDFNLPKNYIFYPANFLPHKNHKYIIDTINILTKKYKRDIKAVFCGADKGYLKKTEDYVSRLNLDNQVIFLNFVDYSDLPFLYKNSIALTMPTLSGPTNIPPWEAFKLNVPVIYSDIFGIKSIYRDAVLYIDPYKVSTMVNAIINLQDNPSIKNKLIDEGKKLIKENNFDNDVKQLLSIFERNKYIKNIWKFEE